MASMWDELKRRNVVRVGIAYAVVAWLTIEVAATIFPILELPDWATKLVLGLLLLGFPVALLFAWAFELTPEGIKKEKDVDRGQSVTRVTGRKLDFVIIGVLVVALAVFALDKFAWRIEVGEGLAANDAALSIAVLPFINMSDDPNNEFFADGIAEEILNLLAKIPELKVTSRSSAFSFKGLNLDVPTMAARLNVDHVLEGSVRKSGDQLRITAQLIEVESDAHLWSETYEREMKNVFAIQDEIAAAVAEALEITLLGQKPRSAATHPEAYALYLQARHFSNLGTPDGSNKAEALIKRALEIDPEYVPAWIELGYAYVTQAQEHGTRTYGEAANLARQAFEQAIISNPESGGAFAALAYLEMSYSWDFDMAAEHLQQAQRLEPNNAGTLGLLARFDVTLGRLDEAISIYQQSIALDPIRGHTSLGVALYLAQRLDDAADAIEMELSLHPDNIYAQYRLAHVRLAQGDTLAALEEFESTPDEGWQLIGRALVHHALGNAEASDLALENLIEKFSENMAYQIAMAYSYRGEIDSAFEWLEAAYESRDSGMINVLTDPVLGNLHGDPRWARFLDKMGLPH